MPFHSGVTSRVQSWWSDVTTGPVAPSFSLETITRPYKRWFAATPSEKILGTTPEKMLDPDVRGFLRRQLHGVEDTGEAPRFFGLAPHARSEVYGRGVEELKTLGPYVGWLWAGMTSEEKAAAVGVAGVVGVRTIGPLAARVLAPIVTGEVTGRAIAKRMPSAALPDIEEPEPEDVAEVFGAEAAPHGRGPLLRYLSDGLQAPSRPGGASILPRGSKGPLLAYMNGG